MQWHIMVGAFGWNPSPPHPIHTCQSCRRSGERSPAPYPILLGTERKPFSWEVTMFAENPANRKMPPLRAVQGSDGQRAVASDKKRKPLTKAEAELIRYYVLFDDLLKSTI
jgi:hypothetical protein